MTDAVEDIVIIGAGPAGTAAATALATAGLVPRILDAGQAGITLPPDIDYLQARRRDHGQSAWLHGGASAMPAEMPGTSPKLRVPGFQRIFRDYAHVNRIRGEDGFRVVGALAAGGLSNAWGCGVSAFDREEIAPIDPGEMGESYARVALRMGIAGACDDDLSSWLGVDDWAGAPVNLDRAHARIWERRHRFQGDVRLGRARVAVLTEPRGGRDACAYLRLCLWGCPRRATWSALHELETLAAQGAVRLSRGWVVDRIRREGEYWRLECATPGSSTAILARRVLLAAGTLATTRLVLAALERDFGPVPLRSNPMAAFLLLHPALVGRAPESGFGLGQVSFRVDIPDHAPAFGSLFSTSGIPMGEFLAHAPATKAGGLKLMRTLLPACSVGNVFLAGELAAHQASVDDSGVLTVHAGAGPGLQDAFDRVQRKLQVAFLRAGSLLLPGSFSRGDPGADLHYASTLPMRAVPGMPHECNASGQVSALPGVYVIDGASLPSLPAKPHTLTIMANADRVATRLARERAG